MPGQRVLPSPRLLLVLLLAKTTTPLLARLALALATRIHPWPWLRMLPMWLVGGTKPEAQGPGLGANTEEADIEETNVAIDEEVKEG